jgi:DNA helicase II / ATP-dependent DNA helicase PcrA
MQREALLEGLNGPQQHAVLHGGKPGAPGLLIIAGAGSGKTRTLAHRVAHLVASGMDPRRVLLLTFTRRAAMEMTRRAQRLVSAAQMRGGLTWSGTFHAMANRLLRLHAVQMSLDPAFTILDRSDAADLMDVVRHRLGLSKKDRRFPQKGTCLAIYSRVVNAQRPLGACVDEAYPWCATWRDELKALFGAYVDEKQRRHVLDYDDLLLYWYQLMADERAAENVRRRFDHVLVDEYQDTNALQAAILFALRPGGAGLTVVGDDAQSIYAFRGATVRNIRDFPDQCLPPAEVVTLSQNYRSTQPVLNAANAVIGLARERFTKDLFSTRKQGGKPRLVSVEDEMLQVDFVVDRILEHREQGIELRQQAVLFRAAHHSDALELELSRRGIPFVKYGGTKFLEAAHVKDVLCTLRWAENPRDSVAAFRVARLVPGIGPAAAQRAFQHLESSRFDLKSLSGFSAPASGEWPGLAELMGKLVEEPWNGQMGRVRGWYQPHLERLYDAARARASDLDQLEQIAAQYASRESFLSELTLDPPEASGDEAGPPLLDEDYLILSTIHSAKGQEWDAVYILNVADGSIPSDMAAGDVAELEEERRLLYVAMTRAKEALYLVHPLRMYVRQQPRYGDRHLFTPRSRFLPEGVLEQFERVAVARPQVAVETSAAGVDVAERLRALWRD